MNMRISIRTTALLAAATLVLGACSGILPESKKIEYKTANKLPPLEIPPDLTAPGRDERYVVPDNSGKSTTFLAMQQQRANTAGTNAGVLPDVGGLRIERSGTQRWLVVPGVPPERLWPVVKEFWQETGLLVNVENPETGVMETDWAENRAKIPQDGIRNLLGRALDSLYSTAERDKYRTRLEKAGDGGTEVYVSHRGMYEVYVTEGKSETRWQPRDADPELEAEMLRRLMVRLGTDNERAKSMLAAASGTPKEERARLNNRNGATSLEVAQSFDRAWRSVGLALDRVGFTVEDRDRSQGVYFVRYVDPEADARKKDTGFMSKLAFWRSDKDGVAKNAQYRISVKSVGDNSSVQVQSKDGVVDNSETARKILGLLHEQLK